MNIISTIVLLASPIFDSIRPLKNKLYIDENTQYCLYFDPNFDQ